MIRSTIRFACLVIGLVSVFGSFSEDIELYDYAASVNYQTRPKVLIVFDDSGSMGDTETGKRGYQSSITYDAVGSIPAGNQYLYYGFSAGSFPTVDASDQFHRFSTTYNSCHQSFSILNERGFYVDTLLEYRRTGLLADSWQPLPSSGGDAIRLVDCAEDVTSSDPENALNWQSGNAEWAGAAGNGYPLDNNPDSPYTLEAGYTPPSSFGSAPPLTIYTANYLRWYYGGCPIDSDTGGCDPNISTEDSKRRIEWAKEAILNATYAAPGVDFGLMTFNSNSGTGNDGGRVVLGIGNYETYSSLETVIENLSPDGYTPLCETTYEAYRYLAGLSVLFGDDDSSVTPVRDTSESVELNGTYVTPFEQCVNEISIVLVTDGEPTADTDANIRIASEFGVGPYTDSQQGVVCLAYLPYSAYPDMTFWEYLLAYFSGQIGCAEEGVVEQSIETYLPSLTQALYDEDTDLLPDEGDFPGRQRVRTFTVGMGDITDDPLVTRMLMAAATGSTASNLTGYYNAKEVGSGLETALSDIISDTLTSQSAFTSPSVATNNFDRTQNLDSIYYAMFQPTSTGSKLHWWGNLKKFRVINDETIADANNNVALSEVDGNIAESAQSYWSSSIDGNDVTRGGVLEHLQNRVAPRKFYADAGSGLRLIDSFDNDTTVAARLGVEQPEVPEFIEWIKGQDIDDLDGDGDTNDKRAQLLGDILHSRPLAVNYGDSGTSHDVRLVVGTNAGVLHMFKDNGDSVEESWAYLPNEFWGLQRDLRNYSGNRDYYGIDGSPVAFSHGEKTWIFFGVRRGGKIYYALDVTSPDSPSLMWRIDSTTPGFELLGQTWSEPTIRYVPGTGSSTPVMIVAGGYDTNKDSDSVGSDDYIGRGVYIVNAETGELVWSVTSETYSGFKDSMPGKVAAIDTDHDGLVDRLYVTDTGANVFRIDMPGADRSTWTVHKFASLGGGEPNSDRRFFYEPAVAQTVVNVKKETVITHPDGTTSTNITNQRIPFDAVLIGSGNRSHPRDVTTGDQFFMLQDRNVVTRSISDSDIAESGGVIHQSDLYDATDRQLNPNNSTSELEAQLLAYGESRGWFHNYTGSGEKTLSSPVVIEGVAYYTTYTPPIPSAQENSCVPIGGGKLYWANLQYGYNEFNSQYIDTGTNVPDTPQLFAGENNIYLICGGCEHVGPVVLPDPGGESEGGADEDPPALQCDENGCDDLFDVGEQLSPERVFQYSKEE